MQSPPCPQTALWGSQDQPRTTGYKAKACFPSRGCSQRAGPGVEWGQAGRAEVSRTLDAEEAGWGARGQEGCCGVSSSGLWTLRSLLGRLHSAFGT